MLWLLAPVGFGSYMVWAILHGSIAVRSRTYFRDKNPRLFWMGVAFYAFIVLVMLFYAWMKFHSVWPDIVPEILRRQISN